MALVHSEITCPICHKQLGEDAADILGFTFLAVGDCDFGMFDDSACHRSCLSRWTQRDRFIAFWNAKMIETFGQNAAQLWVNSDGLVEWRDSKSVTEVIAAFLVKNR